MINEEKIPFSSNNQLVWIPGKSNTSTHNNSELNWIIITLYKNNLLVISYYI